MAQGNTFNRTLPVLLTKSELAERQTELLCIMDDIDETEQRKKLVADDFASDVKKLQAKIIPLRRALQTKHEPRPVECETVPHLSTKMLDIVRFDTGEVVESREMTKSDVDYYSQHKLPT